MEHKHDLPALQDHAKFTQNTKTTWLALARQRSQTNYFFYPFSSFLFSIHNSISIVPPPTPVNENVLLHHEIC